MRKRTAKDKPCSIEGCERDVGRNGARGWCNTHYAQWRRAGDPVGTTRKTPDQRFDENVVRRGDCLIWTGFLQADGYGYFGVDGRNVLTHRYAWERANGPIPAKKVIDHRDHCDKACVNVDHLRLATRTQNRRNLSGPSANNQSGIRNVYPEGDKWSVRLRKNKRPYFFGIYPTVEEAQSVAEQARALLFGDFAGKG